VKTIINFCPTGMVSKKKNNKFLPVHPQEIIEEVHEAYEIGITIAHIHARDEEEVPTYKKEVYGLIFEGIRRYCTDLIICGSCSGRNFPEFEKRSEIIELKPDMCSLTLSSLNFINQASINAPEMIVRLAEKMKDYGVVPEFECFDLGMINYGFYLIEKEIAKPPYYWNLLFGNIAGFQANLSSFSAAINQIPNHHYVSFGGLAKQQLPAISTAIAMGYGVRVGLEDNLWYDQAKTLPATNISLLKRVHSLNEIHQREWMPPSEFGYLGFYNRKGKI
jgi:3-keto-5-aminohexanoate cleavage enzyme